MASSCRCSATYSSIFPWRRRRWDAYARQAWYRTGSFNANWGTVRPKCWWDDTMSSCQARNVNRGLLAFHPDYLHRDLHDPDKTRTHAFPKRSLSFFEYGKPGRNVLLSSPVLPTVRLGLHWGFVLRRMCLEAPRHMMKRTEMTNGPAPAGTRQGFSAGLEC